MADVNREVSIAINVAGDATTKIPEIAKLLTSLVDPIKTLSTNLGTANKGIKDLATNLSTLGTKIPDLTGFSSSLSSLAEKSGSDKLTKLSDSLLAFKDIKLPANFDKFVKGIKDVGDAKKPPDLTQFVAAVRVVAGVKGIPVAQLSGLATSLKKFKGLTGLPQDSLKKFAEGLNKLKDVKGIRSSNLAAIADALKKFSDAKIPTGDKISKFVDGLKRLTEVKGIRVTNLKNIGDALRTFGSLTKMPNLDKFIKSLQTLATIDLKNLTTVAQQIQALAKATASLSNSLPSVTTKLQKNAAAAGTTSTSMNKLTTSVKKADSAYGSFMKKIERYTQYRLIADSIIGLKEAFYVGFQEIVNYDQALKDLQAITSSTAGQVEQMGTTIKQVASDTKFSATEVAVGMRTLGQAGFSAQEGIDAMEHIANLATGTLSSMDQAVDLVSTAIRVYGADQLDAAKASDVFANAVNKSKLTIDKIRTAFNYIGPIAKNAGVSFEESATAMAVLANAGLKASKIGTGLRRVIAELVDPNKRLAEATRSAGLALSDLDPQVHSLDTVLRNLSIILTDSSVAFDLFGKRGAAAALTLTQDINAFKTMEDVIGESGTAAEMAQIQMEGLGVSFKNLRDKLSLVMVALGEAGFIEGMKSFVDVMRSAVDGITDFVNSGVGKIAVQMGIMATKLLVAASAFKALKMVMLAFKSTGFINFLLEFNTKMKGAAISTQLTEKQLIKMNHAARMSGIGFHTMAKGATVATVSIRALTISMAPFLIAFAEMALVFIAIALAVGLFIGAWNKFKTLYISGAQEATKENFKLAESFEGLSKSFATYRNDIAGLDTTSSEYTERNKVLRKELQGIVSEQGALSEAAKKAMLSINALDGSIKDSGDALVEYGKKVDKLHLKKLKDGIKSLATAFEESTNFFAGGFKGMFSKTDAELQRMTDLFKRGVISVDEYAEHLAGLDRTNLTKLAKSTLSGFDAMAIGAEEALEKMSMDGVIDESTLPEEIARLAVEYGYLEKVSDTTARLMTNSFKKHAEAINEQTSAIVQKWEETGGVLKTVYSDTEDIYKNLEADVLSLTDAETQRVANFENAQNLIVLAIKKEEQAYKEKELAYTKAINAAKGNQPELDVVNRQKQADDLEHALKMIELRKKYATLNKEIAKDTTLSRLRAKQVADLEFHLEKEKALKLKTQGETNAAILKAELAHREKLRLANLPVIDEDKLERELDELEAVRDRKLALNEVFAAKSEANAAEAASREIVIQEEYYAQSIAKAEEYAAQYAILNPHATEKDTAESLEKGVELQQEQYEDLLDKATDYYEELNDLKGDYDDLEKKLSKENKVHLKNTQKQFKAEEKFKDKKEDLWDKYKDKREDQLEKLEDLEEGYREDKLDAEKNLRDAILGLEDSLEDKIRKKKQGGMSDKQKAADDAKTYAKKMKEASDLLAKGIRENDEGMIERAAKKYQQSQDLAQSFEKEKKSINGMKKSNDGLIKSEKALADIRGKERDKDYKEDKDDIKTDLATAAKEYEKARKDMIEGFKAAQDDMKQALAEELGVRKDMYKTVKGFEAARHAQVIGDLQVEMDKTEALIALFSQLAPGTEQKAAAAKPGAAAPASGQSGTEKVVQDYKQMGAEIKQETEDIAEHGYRVIEENGKKIYTNLSSAQIQANGLIAESMKEAGAASGAMGEKVKGTYGTILNAVGEVISEIKDGVRVNIKPPENVPDLRKDIPEELEVDVKVGETMGRVSAYLQELQGQITGIGETASGIKIIGPEEEAKIDTVAQKMSGLFDGFSTDDPKQKLQDMITVLEGIGPITHEQGRIAREALQNFADTIPNVNLEDSIVIGEDGNWYEAIKIVNDLGVEYTGLSKDLQSNPLEIVPDALKEQVVNNIENIKGALTGLKEQVTKETQIKLDTSEANRKMGEVLEDFHTKKKMIEGEVITPVVDPDEALDALDSFYTVADENLPDIELTVSKETAEKQAGDAAEAVVVEAQRYLDSKEPLDIQIELSLERTQQALDEFDTKAEGIRTKFDELNDMEVLVSILAEDEEVSETIDKIDKAGEEKHTIRVDSKVSNVEELKEVGTIVEQLDSAEVREVMVEVDIEGEDKVVSLNEAIKEIIGKLVKVIVEVTGIPQLHAAKRAIDAIPNETHKYVYVHTVKVSGKEDGGFIDAVSHFAGGGDVFRRLTAPFIGTGSGTKDDVPAMLMKGEFVLKKSAVEKYGKKFLYAMNMGMLNFNSAASKFAGGGFVNNISTAMTFPSNFEMGGTVDRAQQAAFMMGRKAQLAVNPTAAFQSDDVIYNINAPSFHQHVDSQVSKIKSSPGKARALNLVKLFSSLVPKLQSGGNISELMSQYKQEKNIITQQYAEDIRYAKDSGDDEQVYLLEMEQLQLEELANSLAITLEEIRIDYEREMLDATNDLEEQVADFQEEKEEASADYRDAMLDLNKERAELEREFLKEKRDLERSIAKTEIELKMAEEAFQQGGYSKVLTADYFNRTMGNRFQYKQVKTPAYGMLESKVNSAKADLAEYQSDLRSIEPAYEVDQDHIDAKEEREESAQERTVNNADQGITRTTSAYVAETSLLKSEATSEAKGEVDSAKIDSSMIQLETKHDIAVSKGETTHTVTKLGLDLQLELLHLRQTYDELIREEKRRLEEESKTTYTAAPQQNLGIKYWLNKGGYVGFPKGKKRWEDSIEAMLTPGEYVVNEGAVDHYGVDFMEALNNREVDPEYNAFPSFLSAPKMVNTPTTINGVTYHVNAPSFHDNLADRSHKITTPEGRMSARKMVSIFSDAVPHLAAGGDIGNSEEQLAFEIANTTEEYDERIRYAEAAGAEELVFILENEKIELAMIAEELRYTLEDLKSERDFAIAEAELEYEQDLLNSKQELEEELFNIQMDRLEARTAMQEAIADATYDKQEAQASIDSDKNDYTSDMDEYNDATGVTLGNKLSPAQQAIMSELDGIVYNATGKNIYASLANKNTASMMFTAAKSAIRTGTKAPTSSSGSGSGLWGSSLTGRTGTSSKLDPAAEATALKSIATLQEKFTESTEAPAGVSEPDEPDYTRYENDIERAKDASIRARQRYATLMSMYAIEESNAKKQKVADDSISTRRYTYDVEKAEREFKTGSIKAVHKAKLETRKVKNDSGHEYDQRKEEMINEIKLLEIELAKALFDLKKEYSTADGSVSVKHWLNKGGDVGYPVGATLGTDSVQAMLTPGEYVVSEPAVRKFGVDFFEKLNKMKLPSFKFADGGLVPGSSLLESSGISSDTLLGTVNLQVGKNQYPAKLDLNLAKGLVKEFKKMGMTIA